MCSKDGKKFQRKNQRAKENGQFLIKIRTTERKKRLQQLLNFQRKGRQKLDENEVYSEFKRRNVEFKLKEKNKIKYNETK